MRTLVVGAAPVPGEYAFYNALLAEAHEVIAADAAAEWCVALGRVPDVAVGDFDSAEPGAAERLTALGVDVTCFPTDKDVSDLDLAVATARGRGARSVTLTACAHLRLDHTLAALGTLMGTADLDGELVEPEFAAWPLDADSRRVIHLVGPTGALVSVFSIGGTAEGVTLDGFRFPLDDAVLPPLSSLGLSNALRSSSASVALGHGRLLVMATGRGIGRASVRAVTLG
jgi:thiamine pyrophosphokinase